MCGFYRFGDLEPGTFFQANELEWVKLPDFESDGPILNALVRSDVPAQSEHSTVRTSFFSVGALTQKR